MKVLAWLLAFRLWLGPVVADPQPEHSIGLLVIYNGQFMVEANADWHGYDLSAFPNRCGLSAISPAMLGRIAYVRVGSSGPWDGPCLVVDGVSAQDAVDSIDGRHEVAEVSYAQALRLDPSFANGGRWGEVWFGLCPPDGRAHLAPEPYRLTQDYSHWPYRWSSFYPYPTQQRPADCARSLWPVGQAVMQ